MFRLCVRRSKTLTYMGRQTTPAPAGPGPRCAHAHAQRWVYRCASLRPHKQCRPFVSCAVARETVVDQPFQPDLYWSRVNTFTVWKSFAAGEFDYFTFTGNYGIHSPENRWYLFRSKFHKTAPCLWSFVIIKHCEQRDAERVKILLARAIAIALAIVFWTKNRIKNGKRMAIEVFWFSKFQFSACIYRITGNKQNGPVMHAQRAINCAWIDIRYSIGIRHCFIVFVEIVITHFFCFVLYNPMD